MNKLKEFIDERLDSLASFSIKIEQYKKIILQTDNINANRIPTPSSTNADTQSGEISNILIKDIVNLKKLEKRRIEIENTFMQQINKEYSDFCPDIHQSIDVMHRIDSSFYYQEQFNGSFDEVAKLYKSFFKKQQDLKKYNETEIMNQQNLQEKIPAYLILFKWLVDLSRQKFEKSIFQRSQELVHEAKANQKNKLSIIAESQKNQIESQQINGLRVNYQSVRQSKDKSTLQPNLQFQNVKGVDSSQQHSRKNKFRLSTDGRIQTEGFFPANNKLNSCNLSSDEFINYLHVINKMTVKAPQSQQSNHSSATKNNFSKDVYVQSNEHSNTYIKSSNPKQAIIVPQMAQFIISNNPQHSQMKNKFLNINVNIINSNQQSENISNNSNGQDGNQKQISQDAVLQNQNCSKVNSQTSTSSSSQQSNNTTKQDFNINSKGQDIEENKSNKITNEDLIKAHFNLEMQQILQTKKNISSTQNIKQFSKHRKGSSLQIANSLNTSQNGNQISCESQNNNPKKYDVNYQKIIFENQGNNQNKKYGKIIPAAHYPDYKNILDLDNSQNILNYFMRKNYDSSANEVTENGKNLMMSSLLTKNQIIKQTIEKYFSICSAKFPEVSKNSSSSISNQINQAQSSESKERRNLHSQQSKKRRNSGLIMLSQTTPLQQLILSKTNQQNQANNLVEISQGNQCVAVFQNLSATKKLNLSQEKFWDQNQQSCQNKVNSNPLNKTFDAYLDQQIQLNQLICMEDKVNNYNECQIQNNKKRYTVQPGQRDERIHTQGQEMETSTKPKNSSMNLEKLIRITNQNNQANIPKRPQTSMSNFEENAVKQQNFKKIINSNNSQEFKNQQQIKFIQPDNINLHQKINQNTQQNNNNNNQNTNSPQPHQILNNVRVSVDLSGKKTKQSQFQHQQRKHQQIYFENMQLTKTQGFIKNTPSNQANSLSVNSRSILYNYKQQYLPQQFSNQKNSQAQSNLNTKQKINTEANESLSIERDPVVYFPNKNHRRRANSQLNNENLFSSSKQDTINISITNMNLITEFSNQVTSKSGAKPPSSQNSKNISYSKQLMQIQNLQQNSINIIPPFTNLEILNKLETAQGQQKDQQNSSITNNHNVNNFNKIIQKMVYR